MSETIENPVGWFEIPARDFGRAVDFYQKVLNINLATTEFNHEDMAFFPSDRSAYGCSGSVVSSAEYAPSKEGTVIYFQVKDINSTLEKVTKAGGKILYPKKSIGEYGFIAQFIDTEGNRLALHSKS